MPHSAPLFTSSAEVLELRVQLATQTLYIVAQPASDGHRTLALVLPI
jgi:hypothetical protein